jgi:F-type H+-transporting ATPase subunit gamma
MTEQLGGLQRRLVTLRQLEDVVTAMRAIAASRARQSRDRLPGITAFESAVAGAIGQALSLLEPDRPVDHGATGRRLLILFSSEQGFNGGFADRMLDAATTQAVGSEVFLIGSRGSLLAPQRRIHPVWESAMCAHIDGVSAVSARITDALYRHVAEHGTELVSVMFPLWSSGTMTPVTRALIPFDWTRFASSTGLGPLTTLPPDVLLARLAEEYVFAEICEAATQAFAAENEARAAAMMSARSNIQRVRSELETLEQQLRQEEITAEVTELARERPRT